MKKIFEIKTRTGRKIKVTGDHSLFSLNDKSDVVPIEARSLIPGNFIAVPRFIPSTSKIEYINLLNALHKLEGFYVSGNNINDLPLEKIGFVNSAKKGWWKKHSTIPTKIFRKMSLDCKPEHLFIKPRNGRALPAKIELDDDFLTFIGLWLAEGCYDKNSVVVSNGDEECKEIVRRVGNKFKIPIKIHSDRFSLMLNSSILKRVMKNILDLKGSVYAKSVPDWMFNLSNEQIASILKGYFSGDSHVSKFEIQARSCSLELLKCIQTMLLRFGIISRQTKFYQKDKTYGLRISNVEMLRKFKDSIRFLQEAKNKRLEEICLRVSNHDVTDVVPLPKSFLHELEKTVGKFSTNSYYYGSNIGRKKLYSVTLMKNAENEIIRKASMLANSDIFWDEIEYIKEMENSDGYVYDISVPEFENFICEDIVAHNTAELRLPHPHWVPEVARVPTMETYVEGRVDMYELLRTSLRQRPDYIIVGEVRGREAYVLFQQMAIGHHGLATLHAENFPKLMDRLTTKPIALPPNLIESLDIVLFLRRVRERAGRYIRRIDSVIEIAGYDREKEMPITNELCKWDPKKDDFTITNDSYFIKKIADAHGLRYDFVQDDIRKRAKILSWMIEKNIRDYKRVAALINLFYTAPDYLLERIESEVVL